MPRQEPERTCLVTRTVKPAGEMIRFVIGPGRQVVADLRAKLPGRGVWVTADREHVSEAMKRKLFARGFRAEAKALPTLADDIADLMRADVRQGLSLANKAGNVIVGFAKVESALRDKPVVALVHATEAAEDGRRKLTNQLRKRLGDAILGFPVIQELSNDELGLALGRSHVIHAALVAGAGSDGFLHRWHRYRIYCGLDADQAGPEGGAGDNTILEPAGSERNE